MKKVDFLNEQHLNELTILLKNWNSKEKTNNDFDEILIGVRVSFY